MFPVELQSAQAAAALREALSRMAMLDEQVASARAQASNVVVQACRSATEARAAQKDEAQQRLHELWKTVEECCDNRRDIAESLSRRMNIFDSQVATLLATLGKQQKQQQPHRLVVASPAATDPSMPHETGTCTRLKEVTVPEATKHNGSDSDLPQNQPQLPSSNQLEESTSNNAFIQSSRQTNDQPADQPQEHSDRVTPPSTDNKTSNSPPHDKGSSTATADPNTQNHSTSRHHATPGDASLLPKKYNTINKKEQKSEQHPCHENKPLASVGDEKIPTKRRRSPKQDCATAGTRETRRGRYNHQYNREKDKPGDQENQIVLRTKNQDEVPSCRPARIRALRPSRDNHIPNRRAQTPLDMFKANLLAGHRIDDDNIHEKRQARETLRDSKTTRSAPKEPADGTQDAEPLYCYCQRPYREGEDRMIACDGEDCPVEWFHYECVQIISPPRGKWFCSECKANRNARTRRRLS